MDEETRALLDREWRTMVRGMLDRHPDPAVQADIWDYLEGRITRRMLRDRPAFMTAYRAEQQAQLDRFRRPDGSSGLGEVMAQLTARGGGAEKVREEALAELLAELPPSVRAFAERHFREGAGGADGS